jgi:predicted Fe-Mo cluster-binding NifX family protein
MKLVAIPNFRTRISPRLDYAGSLQLFTINAIGEFKKETIKMVCHSNLERVNLIISLKPDIVICNGISDLLHNELEHNNIEVIPWIHGEVDEVLLKFLNGKMIKTVKSVIK